MRVGPGHTATPDPGLIRIPMLLLLTAVLAVSAGAQPGSGYSVEWIGQFPGEGGEKKTSFMDHVSRLVFGQKPREVIKPFNMVAADPEHFWILDQGARGVLEVKDGEGKWIRSMRKGDQDYPSLVGMCRLPGGDILCTDSKLNQVFNVSGGSVSLVGDSVKFIQPTGIAVNSSTGVIWVVETGAHRISLVSPQGKLLKRIGGRGTDPGLFNYPTFIWIDQAGRVYIVDSMNFRIQILDQEGHFLTAFGENGDATGYMARPKGVATDHQGNIFIADALFHVVQIFDREGRFLYSFGNQGQGEGEFWIPAGIFIDEKDFIYVADSYNARIQVFQLVKND